MRSIAASVLTILVLACQQAPSEVIPASDNDQVIGRGADLEYTRRHELGRAHSEVAEKSDGSTDVYLK